MGIGYLRLQVTTADDAMPVAGANVEVDHPDGTILYETDTNANGTTGYLPLTAPDARYTLDPNYREPAYSVCNVVVRAKGFVTEHIHGVEIVDTQKSILPVHMHPLIAEPRQMTDDYIDIPPVGLLISEDYKKVDPPETRVLSGVLIPEYITVHLGIPTNASARNVRVKFSEYVKNVTSSEIYSTWPYNSLVANIHAIVSFALNRVFTEWYRSRGFQFDITNSTSYDQYYRDGGVIFENISRIVDGIFNVYARRIGFRNPFFTQFCNGTTVTCPGLSQWGTVTLANRGMTPIEILHYYYPNDLELVSSNNIAAIVETYPGYSLGMGSQGDNVRRIQNFLNRIRVNFPLIPQISNPNGVFGIETQNAVRAFQQTFNLTADGIVGRATWNKMTFIYVGVTRLAELDGEGVRVSIGQSPPNVVLSQGSRGEHVLELQFILNTVAQYHDTVPTVIKDGVFGASVKNSVMEFQRTFGLTPDGVVGVGTWNKLYSVYRGIENNAPLPEQPAPPAPNAPPYPGTPLRIGSTGANVRLMQTYLNTIRIVYTSIPYLVVDGSFGESTRASVVAFQQEFLLSADGVIGSETWNKIVEMYLLVTGNTSISLEYPGEPLRVGSTGNSVRIMQQFLLDLRAPYPSLPAITVDGIFGPNTESAVIHFQRLTGLTPDGIIGPLTWYAIIAERNAAV